MLYLQFDNAMKITFYYSKYTYLQIFYIQMYSYEIDNTGLHKICNINVNNIFISTFSC